MKIKNGIIWKGMPEEINSRFDGEGEAIKFSTEDEKDAILWRENE